MSMASSSILPPNLHLFSTGGIALSFGLLSAITLTYLAATAIYNIYFHTLSHIPGPRLAAVTRIPYSRRLLNGKLLPWLKQLHDEYGEVVRYAPNDVSFISGETAWQDIYGFRTGKNKTNPYQKDLAWYITPVNGVYGIITATAEAHSRMRRSLAHAFSDKALREQEGILQSYIDLLIHRLRDQVEQGKPEVDMTRWYNYTTFDIITDLCFGEPLYCLRDNEYHSWVYLIFQTVKAFGVRNVVRGYPGLLALSRKMVPKEALEKREEFFHLVSEKSAARLEKGAVRPDIISYYIKNKDPESEDLTKKELESSLVAILTAGSETTATLLSGTTYLLLKHPEYLSKLVDEIRSRFKSQSEITIDEVNKMPFLLACLQEGMRFYPPAPAGFPRIVPKEGDRISGYYIPGGTSVSVSHHAAYHSARNFTDPDEFIPGRWSEEPEERFRGDKVAAFQPFSFGPRNCLGKNLAYAEMRLIMAKMIFNFDFELVDPEVDWLDQKCFTLWNKNPLMVRLKSVKR